MKRSMLISIAGAAATAAAALALTIPHLASAHSVPNCDTKHYVSDITVSHGRHIKHYRSYVTAASTPEVRVYSTVGDDFGSIYYACWRKTGHSYRLAVNTGGANVYDAYVRDVVVQGSYVGFTYDARGDAPNNWDEWVVVHASTGHRTQDVKVVVPEQTPLHDSAVALTPEGKLAPVYWDTDGTAHLAPTG